MALAKANRLRRRQDFSTVYQRGLRRSTVHLTLRALRHQPYAVGSNIADQEKSEVAQPIQVGISISQKVSKRAVVRNRIKRQIRAVLRQLLPQMSPNWQLVIVVKPSAIECGYEQFLQELKQLLINAEVINGD
ncbi:MAG: ribonuclease P protein component [Cyanobacteria bacterium CRU_2_1]|nr:ribonuclease P protein component [Cyanobacteria bacterium RU_5_0]NJR57542.1 ribonuclease P protein component [Cyanobacteria bacterium CRU_2_1]